MSDHFDHPNPDEPGSAPPGSGDLAADFFDDAAESLPAFEGEDEGIPLDPPVETFKPTAPPAPEERPAAPVFPVVMLLLMLGVLAVAWFISKQPAPAAPEAAAPAAPAAGPAPAPAPAPSDVQAGEVKELKSLAASLADQIKALEAKIAALPKPEPAPDLKSIQGRLDELAKSVAGVGPLSDQIGKLGDRVGEVDGLVKSVSGELDELKGQVKALAKAAAPAETPSAGAPDAMAAAAALFKDGKYKESSEAFAKLAAASPKDARVYYYAALARGAATNDWVGDTVALVTKGIDLEKSGSPAVADIDATFAQLPAPVKRWLDDYRKRAH